MKTLVRGATIITLSIVSALTLGACGGVQGSSGSRAEIYGTVGQMLDDTSDVVVGTVTAEEVIKPDKEGGITVTLATVQVAEVFSPARAGESLRESGYATGSIRAKQSVTVRQMGAPDFVEAPAPFLEKGATYLLFLNPASLDGEAAGQFTVVGVVAGMYVQEGAAFTAVSATDEGRRALEAEGSEPVDDLPVVIDPKSDLQ